MLTVVVSTNSEPVIVSSYKEAARMVRGFLQTNAWGSTKWYSQKRTSNGLLPGAILDKGVQVAYVSYNGRVWKGIDTGKTGGEEIPT